ncbi:MAG: nucleotidyltransferase family protein [Nitrosopumilus sp. H13]|nr:MAG: nucleotidyltransferase family protein [Nitrosopumilus sp. H13]
MKAVILAGGLGTRLQPYTMFLPKPMLPLGEKPMLEHIIEWTRKNGIDSVVLCVSYLRRRIEEYFEDGARFGVNIEYATSDRPLSTAGQLKTAEKYIDGTFVCMYGDSIFDFALRSMIRRHKKTGALVTMGLSEYKTNMPYGVIKTKGGRVTSWDEKPEIKADVNMGCYVMEPKIFGYIPKNRQYGMDDLIKKAMTKGLVGSYSAKNGFIDIGDKDTYKKAHQDYIRRLGKI